MVEKLTEQQAIGVVEDLTSDVEVISDQITIATNKTIEELQEILARFNQEMMNVGVEELTQQEAITAREAELNRDQMALYLVLISLSMQGGRDDNGMLRIRLLNMVQGNMGDALKHKEKLEAIIAGEEELERTTAEE